MQKQHTEKPVSYNLNESEADLASLQHHMELFVSKKVGKFIFANENTEEIHKRTEVKNTDSFD